MLHENIDRDAVHGRVIRREMTKNLDMSCDDIMDEINHALELNWGKDSKEWREVTLYATMLDVMGRISNRVLVGLPLCRNKEYLQHSSNFVRTVALTASLINLCPFVFRPIVASLLMLTDLRHYRGIAKFICPIVKQRLGAFRPGLDYRKPDYSQHNDYVQWALHDAFSHDDPIEREPQMIAKRLSVLSFAAIQSSVITITNALFDIASSPDCVCIQKCLRDEVQVVTAKHRGREWTRTSLADMIRIDSCLRESMRLWGFISRGIMKMVVAPQGVTLPSGAHIPYGAKVGVTAYAIHHDESVYPQSFEYNAFRFLRPASDSASDQSAGEITKPPSMVSSSETFMGFSHGRHTCPGRFFAANQLKLLLAAIVTKYDIEPIPERPLNQWFNNTIGPPFWSKIRIRRRAEALAIPVMSEQP